MYNRAGAGKASIGSVIVQLLRHLHIKNNALSCSGGTRCTRWRHFNPRDILVIFMLQLFGSFLLAPTPAHALTTRSRVRSAHIQEARPPHILLPHVVGDLCLT
jgi:hypothetical protein